MAKATAIKLGELNICLPGVCKCKKNVFRRGCVVPDFPVDGHNCRVMGDAEAWVIHSNPASTTHVAEGRQQLDQLNLLVRKLGPCAITI